MAKFPLTFSLKRLERLKKLRAKAEKLLQNSKKTKEENNETVSDVRARALFKKANPPKEVLDQMVKDSVESLNKSVMMEEGEKSSPLAGQTNPVVMKVWQKLKESGDLEGLSDDEVLEKVVSTAEQLANWSKEQ